MCWSKALPIYHECIIIMIYALSKKQTKRSSLSSRVEFMFLEERKTSSFSSLLFSSLIIIQSHIFLRVAYKISSIHHHHQHLSIRRQRQRQNRQKAAEQKREFMSYINITIRYLDSTLILFLQIDSQQPQLLILSYHIYTVEHRII